MACHSVARRTKEGGGNLINKPASIVDLTGASAEEYNNNMPQQKNDTKKILDAFAKHSKDTRRHFDVVAEGIDDKIKLLSEQVADNTEQITGLRTDVTGLKEDVTELKEDMSEVKNDLSVIKTDVGIIKNELKQKVPREEFVVLEKRVGVLEAKAQR